MTMYAIGELKYDFSSFCAIARMLRMGGFSFDRLARLGRGCLSFVGREREEHVLEAHAHRAHLEQAPSAADDGAREIAAHVAPLLAVDLVGHHARSEEHTS